MKNQDKFCVIGGQYFPVHYGNTPTLLGAKRLAGKHHEYWDNWQGWHVPAVYRIEDVEEINHYFAGLTLAPKPDAEPVAYAWYSESSNKVFWEESK